MSYADQTYDVSKPYNQEIREILEEYSFEYMSQTMKAAARALRNSDYVNPDIKRQLLKEIMRCWEQVSNVILIIMPLLIERGRASFDGSGFFLDGDFGDTPETRLQTILNELPANVVNWYRNDIFSQKIGPLLIDHLMNETNEVLKHELILLMIVQRPRGWKDQVQNYIMKLNRNSFFLWDVYRSLRGQYRYSFASHHALNEIKYLIQVAIAKHETGQKMPSLSVVKNYQGAIPHREENDD